jgi:predicted ATP-grasp superfamily ATP-dependent carboligase
MQIDEQWPLPVGTKHQAVRALMVNRRLLDYLNKYPSPMSLSGSLVPSIRHNLEQLRTLNEQIAEKSSRWLETGEE